MGEDVGEQAVGMGLGFRGEVADFYHRFRRGYPPAVIDVLVDAFDLTKHDVVVDLGCGTGQLALPIAPRVRAVLGVDPEPDMLLHARRAATGKGVTNISWVIGADTDMPTLGALLGSRSVAAVTIGQALHWMKHDDLFRALVPLTRPGGGVAVVTNGMPLWLQDNDWSHALRDFLEQWRGKKPTFTCGTDEASQQRYRDGLAAAGFQVHESSVEYTDEIDFDQLVGGTYSALTVDQLPPPEQRPLFAERLRQAVLPHAPFTEHVRVAIQMGRAPAGEPIAVRT